MIREYTVRSTVTRTESRLRKAADIAIVALISAVLVFVLFRFVLVPYEVTDPGVSELREGEMVLVDRFSLFVSEYELGDLLRIRTPEGEAFLRVAAKGGSTYKVVNGRAYLDGSLIDESGYGGDWGGADGLSVAVPEGFLLLLPDSRGEATDLGAGLVSYSDIIGEVRFRIMPFGRIAVFS